MSTPHVYRHASLLTIISFIAVTLLASSPVRAASVNAKPPPPQSSAYGRSLPQWMNLYFTWLLGGDQADHVGRVQFLPLPAGTPVAGTGTVEDPLIVRGHLDQTFAPGTPFVVPVVAWIGETYDPALGIPDDQPLDASIFTNSNVLVTVDGKPLIDSSNEDVSTYYFEPVYFDEPIFYEEPTAYGSIGALWVQGIGFVHHPLSIGTHTITIHSELIIPELHLGYVYENTWTITVEPPSRNK